MSPKYSETIIEQVRNANDIVDVISQYLTLKKSGKRFVGLCPFHQDSAPSFSVDPEKQLFHCFGCKRGGSVFNFIMEIEKLTFPQSVKFLAEKAGISLNDSPQNLQLEKEKEALYFVNRWAANFFYQNLFSEAGKAGLDYIQSRGISPEMIKKFGLGYALPQWDGLIKKAQKDQVSLESLHKAGLIIKKDNGGYYDRFRGRFVIPILNLNKKVLGFGGRIINDDPQQPKYINSPETPIYRKGYVLFGLLQSRPEIQKLDQVIFVEGYTDLISLFQHGIQNVVATSGTALTSHQAKLIKRYTQNVVMLFDADSAGSAAAIRGAELFLDEDIDVSIVTLPPGLDPDNFIQTQGADQFHNLIHQAMSLTQFKINLLTKQYDRETNQGMSHIITELLSSVARIKDPVKQNLTIKEIAEYFALEERALFQKLEMMKRGRTTYRPTEVTPLEKKPEQQPQQKSRYELAEKNLLRLAFSDINWMRTIFDHLSLDDISDPLHRDFFSRLIDIYNSYEFVETNDIAALIADAKLAPLISEFLNEPLPPNTDQKKLIVDCVAMLRRKSYEKLLHDVTLAIKSAEAGGKDTTELLKQHQELLRGIARLDSKQFLKNFTDESER
ncbi:MAG: DNA primase [Calditrichaeota bacterium]|nr:DNA primase [Calditrichota bacterium]